MPAASTSPSLVVRCSAVMLPPTKRFSETVHRRAQGIAEFCRDPAVALALLSVLGVSGCRCSDEPDSQAKAAASAPAPVERGDAVLVEPSAGEFYEARVLALENTAGSERLKLQRSDGELTSAAAVDVYRLRRGPDQNLADDPSHPTPPSAGALAMCEVQKQRWVGCRVQAVSSAGIRVEDYGGEEHHIALRKLVLPGDLTRMNLEQRFKQADRRLSFERDARRAGHPSAPPGFSPSYKERVIARRGDEWLSAHIVRFHDDGSFRVRWMADERENDIAKADVIPEPPYSKPPKRGGFVLVKPNVQSLPWPRRRVVSVRPELVLEDGSGERTSLSVREVVPLDPDFADPGQPEQALDPP